MAASKITRIRLDSHRPGDAPPYTLDLYRDGRARLTLWGSGREGTEDLVQEGRLDGQRYQALARLLISLGFFGMEETYADPELRDGPWASITAWRGESEKLVFSRADAGPESLKVLERALAAQRSRIRATPTASRP